MIASLENPDPKKGERTSDFEFPAELFRGVLDVVKLL